MCIGDVSAGGPRSGSRSVSCRARNAEIGMVHVVPSLSRTHAQLVRALDYRLDGCRPRRVVAVGYENVWHTNGTDGGQSVYGVLSSVLLHGRIPPLRSEPLSSHSGWERAAFDQRGDVARGRRGEPVRECRLRVSSRVIGIANGSDRGLNLAMSVTPTWRRPLVLTSALPDVARRASDGTRVAVSAPIALHLGK